VPPSDPYVIVGLVAVFGTTAWNGIAQGLATRKKEKQDALDRQQIAEIKKTGIDTHTLSNSAMGVILKLSAVKSRQIYMLLKRIAELTKDPGDIAAVDVAQIEWILAERTAGKHEGQQETVDAGGKAR